MTKNNIIPPMTHELGRHWEQPNPAGILIDDTHALMSRRDFNWLADYSTTYPSGVYEGKMWRRDNFFLSKVAGWGGSAEFKWSLCWYGESEKADHCRVFSREILIVE